jgi:2-Cys peroxiredoxin 5
MGAWGESLDPEKKSGVRVSQSTLPPPFLTRNSQLRFLADPHAEFSKKLDLMFDSAAVFGQDRSKRYAIVTEDGKVKSVHVEPDNTGINGM